METEVYEEEEDTEIPIIWAEESQSYLTEDWEKNHPNLYKFVREGYTPPVRPPEMPTQSFTEFGAEIPPGADISDWFNYGELHTGLNPRTLQEYINQQIQLRKEAIRKYQESQSDTFAKKGSSPNRSRTRSRHRDKKKKHDRHKHSKRES